MAEFIVLIIFGLKKLMREIEVKKKGNISNILIKISWFFYGAYLLLLF